MWCKHYGLLLLLTALAVTTPSEPIEPPRPEDIKEAYDLGLIDFEYYREMLEISRRSISSAADSLLLRRFIDLQTGFSGNPHFALDDGIADDVVADLAPPKPP